MLIQADELKKYNISTIETVQFGLRMTTGTWSGYKGHIIAEEPITLNTSISLK